MTGLHTECTESMPFLSQICPCVQSMSADVHVQEDLLSHQALIDFVETMTSHHVHVQKTKGLGNFTSSSGSNLGHYCLVMRSHLYGIVK